MTQNKKHLTYQETLELEQFYRDNFEYDKARDVEVLRDHLLDKAYDEQACRMEELANFAGGPRQ